MELDGISADTAAFCGERLVITSKTDDGGTELTTVYGSDISSVPLMLPDMLRDEYFLGFWLGDGNNALVQTPGKLYRLDIGTGDCEQLEAYDGEMDILSDGMNGFSAVNGRENDTVISLLDGSFSTAEKFTVSATFEEIYPGVPGDRYSLCVRKVGQIRLLDIRSGEYTDYANLQISGADSYTFSYIDGDRFLSSRGGVPAVWTRSTESDVITLILATCSDPELDRSDFMSEPLKAMEINGKLYQATSSFMLFTMMGAATDVGSPDEWTYAALEQKIAESEQYQRLTDELSKPSDWLRVTFEASGARLVDWEKGVCHFDSDYFIHLLELSAGMERPDTESATPRRILRDTGALLFTLTSRGVWEGAVGAQTFGDGNYAFVGYPEVGAVIYPTESVGISAQSGSKEDCWQFVRQFMVKGARSGFPLRYDEIEEDYELACKDVHTTEGEKQAIRDFIAHAESASVCCRPDEQLWAIIESELNRFYAGQNTAVQTAQAIQSRASIYLSEQN